MPHSRPRLLRLSILSILFSLCTLEVIYRLPTLNTWDLIQADDYLNHRGTPRYRREDGAALIINHNSSGWMELADIPSAPSSSKTRVVFMGDSFTYGTAHFFESMPRVVASALDRIAPGSFEVINAGFPSYSPVIYRLQLEREVLPLRPRVVVISVDVADVVDDYLYRRAATRDTNGTLLAVPAQSDISMSVRRVAEGVVERTGVDKALRVASRYSALIFRLSRALDASRYGGEPDPRFPRVRDWCPEKPPTNFQPYVNETLSDIASLVTTIRSVGAIPVVTFIPRLEHLTGQCSTASATAVQMVTEAAGGRYLNSFRAFEGEHPEQLYHPGDIHYNARGYERWGQTIATQIHEYF